MLVSKLVRELNEVLETYGDIQVFVKDDEDDFVTVTKIDVEEADSESSGDEWEAIIS